MKIIDYFFYIAGLLVWNQNGSMAFAALVQAG